MSSLILGIDEVGRGALAGPVVVGAASMADQEEVLLVSDVEKILKRSLADSKKLTAPQRDRTAAYLQERIIWGLGEASALEIDTLGLSAALRVATDRAIDVVERQGHKVNRVLADAGLHHSHEASLPTEHFVKGDETVLPITFASIIAKVYRDALITRMAEHYPEYGWAQNKAYGSAAHIRAIHEHGPCAEHRKLFLRSI